MSDAFASAMSSHDHMRQSFRIAYDSLHLLTLTYVSLLQASSAYFGLLQLTSAYFNLLQLTAGYLDLCELQIGIIVRIRLLRRGRTKQVRFLPNTKPLLLHFSVPLAVMLLFWYKMMTNAGAADLAHVCLVLRTTEQDR